MTYRELNFKNYNNFVVFHWLLPLSLAIVTFNPNIIFIFVVTWFKIYPIFKKMDEIKKEFEDVFDQFNSNMELDLDKLKNMLLIGNTVVSSEMIDYNINILKLMREVVPVEKSYVIDNLTEFYNNLKAKYLKQYKLKLLNPVMVLFTEKYSLQTAELVKESLNEIHS